MSNSKNITAITVTHDDGTVRTVRGVGTFDEVKTSKRPDVPDEKRGKRAKTQPKLETYTYFTAKLFPDEVVAAVESADPSVISERVVPPSQNAPEES